MSISLSRTSGRTLREEEIYEAADAITVPSSFAARSFVNMGLPAEKIHRIPYGVRLERFHRVGEPDAGSSRFSSPVPSGYAKEFPICWRPLRRLSHPKKRLRMAGAIQPDIRDVLARLPQKNVEFLGTVSQERMVELMSTSHVMVLPSIEEGLALVQGQALACSCRSLRRLTPGLRTCLPTESKDSSCLFAIPTPWPPVCSSSRKIHHFSNE